MLEKRTLKGTHDLDLIRSILFLKTWVTIQFPLVLNFASKEKFICIFLRIHSPKVAYNAKATPNQVLKMVTLVSAIDSSCPRDLP